MTAEDQLNYVYKYFALQIRRHGPIVTLEDTYMAILWPKGISLGMDDVLISEGQRPVTYRQNSGLDINHDGAITKREATERVRRLLREGLEAPDVHIPTQ
jgi:hypothetical protein